MRRLPIGLLTALAIGGLTAAAVTVTLYLGLAGATDNTRRLLSEQVDGLLTSIEDRLASRLNPVVEQSRWMARTFEADAVSLDDARGLDAFMLGALSATPQVAGMALVGTDAYSRRWARSGPEFVAEDWSGRPEIVEWIRAGREGAEAAWIEPFWTATIDATVLLHQEPIRQHGRYQGMLGQIVPVTGVSAELVELTAGQGMVPFILYDGDRVLAHPVIAAAGPAQRQETSLPKLSDFGDKVLERIWTPDESQIFLLSSLTSASAVVATIGEHQYGYLYRTLTRFGPRPWTVGVYLDLDAEEDSVVDRLFYALIAGLAVLVASVAIALWFARLLSRPVSELAATATRVGEGALDEVAVLGRSRILEIDQATQSINAMVEGLRERQTIRETLGRYVPEPVARKLLSQRGELAAQSAEATVLFCDLRGFTALTERLGAQGVIELLNEYFTGMVQIIERHGGMVTQFQGDAVLAIFNVPTPLPGHAKLAVQAACAMLEAVRGQTFCGHAVGIRIGISTGSVVAGAVGAKGRLSYTVHGDAVNLAARLEAMNKHYGTDVLLSASTAACVEGVEFECVGEIPVRGQSVPVEVFALSRVGWDTPSVKKRASPT